MSLLPISIFRNRPTVSLYPKNVTVTSLSVTEAAVTWTDAPAANSVNILIYQSTTSPVTTGNTLLTTKSAATSGSPFAISGTSGDYYAAVAVAHYNSAISSSLGPVFNPTSLTATLVTWFDGTYGLTSSSWSNRGTNGGSATLTSASVTTINGLPAARFPNASTGSSYGAFYQQFANQARAYFIVMKLNTTSTGFQVMMTQTNAGGYNWNMYGYSSSCAKLLNNNNNGSNIANPVNKVYESYTTDTDQTNLNIYNVINSASATSNNYSFTNNTSRSLATSVTASGYKTTNTLTYIAAAPPGGMYSADCSICEVMAYDGEVTAYEASNVRFYLGLKWGISIPQPTVASIHAFTEITAYSGGFVITNTSGLVVFGQNQPQGSGVSPCFSGYMSGNMTVTGTPATLTYAITMNSALGAGYISGYYYSGANQTGTQVSFFGDTPQQDVTYLTGSLTLPVGTSSYYIGYQDTPAGVCIDNTVNYSLFIS